MIKIVQIVPVIILLTIPVSQMFGQDLKNEQKIKIIVKDGSKSKVVLDTIFTDNKGPDSLKLKDGSVVHLQHQGDQNMVVTYSSDGDKNGKEYKEVTIISSDSVQTNDTDNHNIVSNSSSGSRSYTVIKKKNGNYMYINKDKRTGNADDDTFNVYISDKNDDSINRSRYVIAKDGMVVTIESNDDEKAQEMVKAVQNKLGIKNESDEKDNNKAQNHKKGH